jgi:hypothetical protein
MNLRTDRIVLALEVLFGVVPTTIVGGGYSILGVVFGTVSVFLSVRGLAFDALVLWLGILALAASGVMGIVGLWALIALSAAYRPPSSQMIRIASVGSIVGVLAAVVALGSMLVGGADRRPLFIYILVAPILVVLHRGRRLKRS